MKRRWIIRSFFVGLLLLCVAGWASSYLTSIQFNYVSARFEISIFDVPGATCFAWGGPWRHDLGWYLITGGEPGCYSEGTLTNQFLGMAVDAENGFGVRIPFWVPISLSAAVLWLVWRKTRPPVKGRAFPVKAGGS